MKFRSQELVYIWRLWIWNQKLLNGITIWMSEQNRLHDKVKQMMCVTLWIGRSKDISVEIWEMNWQNDRMETDNQYSKFLCVFISSKRVDQRREELLNYQIIFLERNRWRAVYRMWFFYAVCLFQAFSLAMPKPNDWAIGSSSLRQCRVIVLVK